MPSQLIFEPETNGHASDAGSILIPPLTLFNAHTSIHEMHGQFAGMKITVMPCATPVIDFLKLVRTLNIPISKRSNSASNDSVF